MANIFADFLDKFKFSDEKTEERAHSNQIATDGHDGAIEVNADSISQFAMNLDWSYSTQAEMIERYREVSTYPMVDFAIEDIIGEMVSFTDEQTPVELDLSEVPEEDLSDSMKEKVRASWDKIERMLDLKQTIHRRAKQFYVDGRLVYQKVIDKKKPTDGLLDVIELDSKFVTKYRSVKYDEQDQVITGIEEYFVYDESNGAQKTKKNTDRDSTYRTAKVLNPNSITYVTSGLTDPSSGYAISWLHKAVKPANQLRMMENALVIYRITRAPERRIFYVDTANLPRNKAEQYLRGLKNNYRNRMSFDAESGQFKDTKHLQTMQEDFWLPRNSSGKGTEVDTLPGGQNLSDIEDVLYFQKQLYKALNIPVSRLESDSLMPLGRQAEISRDELKFSKFVSKIRKRFNMMFLDLLKTELILTKMITAKEWALIEQNINFKYALDMYIEEMKQSEMLRDRIDLLEQMNPYIGKYISNQTARKELLKQTDEEMDEEDKLIQEEKTNEQYYPSEDEEGGFGGRRF